MGSAYIFLLIVVLLGPERMNHDAILKDRKQFAEINEDYVA